MEQSSTLVGILECAVMMMIEEYPWDNYLISWRAIDNHRRHRG